MDDVNLLRELFQEFAVPIAIGVGSLIVAMLSSAAVIVRSMGKSRKVAIAAAENQNKREDLFVTLVEDVRKDNERITQALQDARAEIKVLRTALDDQTRNTNRLERQQMEDKQKIDSLTHDIEALNNNLAQARRESKQLKTGLELERTQRENIESERTTMLSTLQREREEHAQVMEDKDGEIRVLTATVDSLKTEVSTLRARMERLETSTQPVTPPTD